MACAPWRRCIGVAKLHGLPAARLSSGGFVDPGLPAPPTAAITRCGARAGLSGSGSRFRENRVDPGTPPGSLRQRAGHDGLPADADNFGSVYAEPTPEAPADWACPRTYALLPSSLLQDGEVVILLLKPSPWYLLLGSLKSLVAVAILLAAVLWLDSLGYRFVGRRDLVLLAIFVVGGRLFWQFLEWLSRIYVLTDRRVIRVKGVIRVQIFEAQLSQIQHTETLFSLRERLFGLGSIGFATAGTAVTEAYWEMLARPLDVHRIVVQTLSRYRR